ADDPNNPTVRASLGRLYLTTGRVNDAKKIYNELMAQRSTDVAALLSLGEIAVAEKRWTEASDYLTRARAAAPNDPAPGLMLINMYGLQQDWKNAMPLAAELVAQFPANIDILDAQGRLQLGSGDTNGALATYWRAHELAPDSSPILSRYLAVLMSAKKFPDARDLLQAALDRDPGNVSLKGDMIRVEAEIGGLDAGIAKARRFADTDPGKSVYDLVAAELYEKAGRSRDAVALLDKVVATRPSDDNITLALFRLYGRTDDLAKAEGVLTARLSADPKDVAIRAVLAGFYLE